MRPMSGRVMSSASSACPARMAAGPFGSKCTRGMSSRVFGAPGAPAGALRGGTPAGRGTCGKSTRVPAVGGGGCAAGNGATGNGAVGGGTGGEALWWPA